MLANKLNYGDTIGVVGVSNSIYLEENGYEDFCKAEDMMNMFKDKEVKAIICLTGGENAEECFKEFESVFLNRKIRKFANGEKKIIKEGNALGKIIGTNIGCMMYLLGTEYLPDMQEKILLIESYKTSLNQCQRRFAHLKQYGMFDKVKGIIVGYNYDLQKNGDIYPQMEDILLEYTKEYNFPIVKCNDFGHKIINSTIPIGVDIKIENKKVEIIGQFLNEK